MKRAAMRKLSKASIKVSNHIGKHITKSGNVYHLFFSRKIKKAWAEIPEKSGKPSKFTPYISAENVVDAGKKLKEFLDKDGKW